MHRAQDFYNLVDVYLDAVLHPNCVRDPRTFAQEGWHYEVEDPKVRGRRACAAACACGVSGSSTQRPPAPSRWALC